MSVVASDVLTAEDVAEILHVSSDWVYRAARTGELPSMRIGRNVRFLRDDVAAYLQGVRSGGELVLARAKRHSRP